MRALLLCVLTLLAAAVPAASALAADDRPIYRVVVFGDSYAAGEGAPGTPGDYNADGTPKNPPHPAVWKGTSDDVVLTGETSESNLLTGARRCHRSPRATAPQAVKLLIDRFPQINFTFRSFACSGARIEEGITGPYAGAEPIDADHKVPSQISQANTYLGDLPSDERIDALVMNVGGNNLGFGKIIQNCAGVPVNFDPCSPPEASNNGEGNRDTDNILRKGIGIDGEPESKSGLDDLPAMFDFLADRIDGSGTGLSVAPRHVFLTGVPNPLAGGFDGCASLSGQYDYENRLRSDERAWITGTVFPLLNGAFEAATHDRWTFVPLASAVPNGMCAASGRMLNRNRDALATQGATVASAFGVGVSHGWVHPNAAGYAAMAPLLANSLGAKVISDFTPGVPSSAELVPVVDLLPRVELNVGGVSEDFDTRPAGRQAASTGGSVAGAIGAARVTVPVNPAGPTTIQARRCGPLPLAADGTGQGCGVQRNVVARLGTPSPPTSVTTTRDPLGVRVAWTQGSTVPLRRFLLEMTSKVTIATGTVASPAAALVKDATIGGTRAAQELQTLTIKTSYTADPDVREMVLPSPAGARVTVTVRECTDRGCGATAPEPVSIVTGLPADVPDSLARPFVEQERADLPLGAFTIQSGLRARAGRPFGLVASWAAWKRWRDLRSMQIRLRGRDGVLATVRVGLQDGRLELARPGGHARRARVGRRGTVRVGAVALGSRGARIVAGGPRSRLVALRLPLTLARSLRGQRIDVEVGAVARGGRAQAPRWAGSFDVR